MKKIAFFVEGETEYLLVEKLLEEIASTKNITVNIKAQKLAGGGKKNPIRTVLCSLKSTINPTALYEAWIYVSGTDNRVDTDIQDFHAKLASSLNPNEFDIIIGLRDLRGEKPDGTAFTLSDLPKMEILMNAAINSCCLPIPTDIIIAVYETEAWFLAECKHFSKIHPLLTHAAISSNIGLDPCTDDMTLQCQPAELLDSIYCIAGKKYLTNQNKKTSKKVKKTIKSLDYNNLLTNVKSKVVKLNDLILKIDAFLI